MRTLFLLTPKPKRVEHEYSACTSPTAREKKKKKNVAHSWALNITCTSSQSQNSCAKVPTWPGSTQHYYMKKKKKGGLVKQEHWGSFNCSNSNPSFIFFFIMGNYKSTPTLATGLTDCYGCEKKKVWLYIKQLVCWWCHRPSNWCCKILDKNSIKYYLQLK